MTDELDAKAEAADVKTRAPRAKAEASEPIPDGHVRARVLPMGHDKIFTGKDVLNAHTVEERFPKHQRGDILVLPHAIAKAQEDAGRLEIL